MKTTATAQYSCGFGDIREKLVNKPMKGHFAKADVALKRTLKEFRLDNAESLNVGDVLKADSFEVGDIVDVCGTSKGKGFQGTIKRNNNARLKETHGTGPVTQTGRFYGCLLFTFKNLQGQGYARSHGC